VKRLHAHLAVEDIELLRSELLRAFSGVTF